MLECADIELAPMRAHLHAAIALAIDLDHPAYDCLYISLALEKACPFVTADQRLLRKVQ